jgi:hypothetical protein
LIALLDKEAYIVALPSGNRTPKVTIEQGVIQFDVGYHEGMAVKAVFEKGRLAVSRIAPANPTLEQQDCEGMYQTLNECTRVGVAECSASTSRLSMASFRHIYSMKQNPGFRASEFEAACQAACRSRTVPPLKVFQAAVCTAARR